MNLGKIKASYFPNVCAIVTGVAILICEYLTIQDKHTKPFPKSTISMTAGYYPEFVIFRVCIQCSATLLILTWIMHSFLLKMKYPKISKYLPSIFIILGTIGAIGLMAASATIDTGDYKNRPHVICAVVFFLATIIACIYNTLLCIIVHIKTKQFSKTNIWLKVIVSGMLFIWMMLALFYKSPYKYFGNVAEYSMTYLILAYILLLGRDMNKFILDYELK